MNTPNGFDTASDLLRPYESNSALLNDDEDWARKAFFAAPASVPEGGDPDTPMLRWVNPDVPAVPLLAALLSPVSHRPTQCARCERALPRGLREFALWLVGGQTAVEVHVCPLCHDILNDLYRTGDGQPLLAWRA